MNSQRIAIFFAEQERSSPVTQAYEGLCRSLKFATPVKGSIFDGHVVKNISLRVGMHEVSCRDQCVMEGTCVSFNIGPPTNDTVICQLSDSDHTLHPSDLKLQAGFTYRGTEVKTYRQGKNSYIIYIAIYNIQPSFITYENPHQHHTHFNHHLLLTTIATVIITASKATIYLLRPPLTLRIRIRYFQKQCDKQENAIDLPSKGYRV